MNQHGTSIAADLIEDLLANLEEFITISNIKTQIPHFLGSELFTMIRNSFDAMVIPESSLKRIKQEKVSEVPCIEKDTLMPKEVEKQTPEEYDTLNLSLTSINKKRTGNRGTISRSSRGNSLVSSHGRGTRASAKPSRSPESQLEMLKEDIEIEDPEVLQYRKALQIEIKYQNDYKKLTLQHAKSFKAKVEEMNSFGLADPVNAVTHDFDGQLLKSVLNEDKIQVYLAKAGVGAAKKVFKEGNKTLTPCEPSSIAIPRITKERDPPKDIRSTEMPLFPQPRHGSDLDGFRSFHRNEYKRLFGKGFSRFDQNRSTIDYIPSKQDPTDRYFTERKHLQDSMQMSLMGSGVTRKSSISRRIALPKLHGRYKVLDRYQQK